MQFAKVLLAATACAVASAAKFGMTASQFVDVQVGQTFSISWFEASGPVTVLLKNGEANELKNVQTIASGQSGTSYAWTIPSTLPVDYYAFEVVDDSGVNYSERFLVSGGPALTSSSSSSSSESATSTSSGTSVTTSRSSSSGSTASTTSSGSSAASTSSSLTSGSSTATTGSSLTSGSSTASTGSSLTSGSSTASTTSSLTSGSSNGSSSRTSSSMTTSSTSTPAAINSASGVASPLALVLLAFVAIITLN